MIPIVLLLISPVIILVSAYVKVLYEWRRKVNVIDASNYKEVERRKSKGASTTAAVAVDTVKAIAQAPGPMPWPVLGNLNLLAKHENPFQAFTELSDKYGDVYSLTLGTTRCIVLNNLEMIQDVLIRNGKYFGDRPDFERFHQLFGGDRNNSLALCDWSNLQQKRRNLARRHCSPRDTSNFYSKMSEVGILEMHEFRNLLKTKVGSSGQEVYLKPILQATSANMFCQYMCSTRFDYDDKEFRGMVNLFDNIFWYINEGHAIDFLPWLAPFYGGHMKKIAGWSADIRTFINDRIIRDREQHLRADEEEKDFTDALLKSLFEDETGTVTRDTIMYMLEDFIGGHSAIGNLVMISLGYVAMYPEVGSHIQEELDRVSENGQRDITLFDKDQLPYTVALMFETLRYSSSPIVPHVATEDVIIADYGITKGTVVFINNYKLNTSEKYWTDPEAFRPDRFLEPIKRDDGPAVDDNNNDVVNEEEAAAGAKNDVGGSKYRLKTNIPHFLPFSIGKRTCIGQNLVRSFGFIMIANILQSYNVSCKSPEDIKTYPACVALPADTYPLTLTPRTHD